MRKELTQILIDCIYTADSKPVFLNDNWVGGDLDGKLIRIERAVDRIIEIQGVKSKIDNASHYVCTDDIDVEGQVEAIEKQADIDGNVMIDNVEGVTVWEKVQYTFSCDEFLDLIEN